VERLDGKSGNPGTRCLVLNLSRLPLSELKDGMEARKRNEISVVVSNKSSVKSPRKERAGAVRCPRSKRLEMLCDWFMMGTLDGESGTELQMFFARLGGVVVRTNTTRVL